MNATEQCLSPAAFTTDGLVKFVPARDTNHAQLPRAVVPIVTDMLAESTTTESWPQQNRLF